MNIVIDITEKWNSEVSKRPAYENAPKKLYLTDNINDARLLKAEGHFVVPVLTKDNESLDWNGFSYLISEPEAVTIDYYYRIWQRFVGMPWHILDTERLYIREMSPDDLDAIYKLYEDKSVCQFMEDLYPEPKDELTYIHNYIRNVYSYLEFGTWLIVNKADNEIIGRVGFNYREDYPYPELGFMLAPAYQHQGYAYEACQAVINYAFDVLDFEAIQAMADEHNLPSIALLKKLGFKSSPSQSDLSLYILNMSL